MSPDDPPTNPNLDAAIMNTAHQEVSRAAYYSSHLTHRAAMRAYRDAYGRGLEPRLPRRRYGVWVVRVDLYTTETKEQSK